MAEDVSDILRRIITLEQLEVQLYRDAQTALADAQRNAQQLTFIKGDIGGGTTLIFDVFDCSTSTAVNSATVNVSGTQAHSGVTNSNGVWAVDVSTGTYVASISATGYNPGSISGINIADGQTLTESICLTSGSTVSLSCCGGITPPLTLTCVDPYGTNLTATFDGVVYWIACGTYTTWGGATCGSVTTAIRFRLSTACIIDVQYPAQNPLGSDCPKAENCSFTSNASTAWLSTDAIGDYMTRSGASSVVCSPLSIYQRFNYNDSPTSPRLFNPTGRATGITFRI